MRDSCQIDLVIYIQNGTITACPSIVFVNVTHNKQFTNICQTIFFLLFIRQTLFYK